MTDGQRPDQEASSQSNPTTAPTVSSPHQQGPLSFLFLTFRLFVFFPLSLSRQSCDLAFWILGLKGQRRRREA